MPPKAHSAESFRYDVNAYQKSEKRQYLSDSTRVEPLNVHRTVFHTVVVSATHAEAADDEEERDERTNGSTAVLNQVDVCTYSPRT